MNDHHFIIHKPYGFLSQFVYNEKRRKNRHLIGELYDFPDGIMCIGRLDQDSEGLLLLTTDGKVSELVRRKHVEKEYYVQVDGIVPEDKLNALQNGVKISIHGSNYQTLPCKAKLINTPSFKERTKKVRDERHGPTSWLSITITEGKFRQVRKMTAAVGHATLRLVRVRIGNIHLNDLQSGEVIPVNDLKEAYVKQL